MKNVPDEAAKPMGNGPDGLIVSQARYQSAIDNLENGSFRLGRGVGSLKYRKIQISCSTFLGDSGVIVQALSFIEGKQLRSSDSGLRGTLDRTWVEGLGNTGNLARAYTSLLRQDG